MKTTLAYALFALGCLSVSAKDAFDFIAENGTLKFTDGSSVYSFERNGDFKLVPRGISGRTISGTWRESEGFFIIEGTWSWMNGGSISNDIRTMKIYVSPYPEKEALYRLGRDEVQKVYFIIESIGKKTEA